MSADAVLRLIIQPSILAQLLLSRLGLAVRVIVILAAGNSLAEAAENTGWRLSVSPYIKKLARISHRSVVSPFD